MNGIVFSGGGGGGILRGVETRDTMYLLLGVLILRVDISA